MPYSDTKQRLIDLLKQLGVAALYVLIARIVLAFFSDNGVVSVIWPPSGLALAVLLIGGKRYSWGVFLGAFLASTMNGISLLTDIAIATGNTLEALIGTWLLTRNSGFDRTLKSLRSYLLLVIAGGISSISGALVGATTLLLAGVLAPGTYTINLAHWWMGDVLGIALVAPLTLVCWQAKTGWRETQRLAEAALLLGLTFLAGQVVFLGWFHDSLSQIARGYVMFLFITWVAVRLGTNGAVIALTMTAIQALLGAHLRIGFFANSIVHDHLTHYWLYVMILSTVGIALATFISGKEQSEEALRRSEAKFRTLYDSTGEAVMLLDGKGFFDCNRAAMAMFGCATKEEFCAKQPVDLSPPEQPDGTSSLQLSKQYIDMAMEKGSHRFEWLCKRADTGAIFMVEGLLSAMELDGNTVLQVVARDVTGQKRAREELQRFFDLVPDMVCIASADGHFMKINRAWQTTLGYSEQEILASPFLHFIHPDDRDATMKEVERQLAGEATIRFINRYRCKNGSYKWLEWDATPAVGKTLLFASARDITERKQMEDTSRLAKVVLDTAMNGFWVVGKTGNLLEVNAAYAKMSGYTADELLNMHISQLDANERSIEEVNARIEKIVAQGYDRFETRHRRKDGQEIDVEVSARFMPGSQKFYSFLRDITERKTVEKELQDSKKQLQATLDAIPDLLFEIGLDERVYDYHSPRTDLLAAPPDIFLGKTLAEILPLRAEEVCVSALREAHENGVSMGKQYELLLPQGKLWFELSVSRKATDPGQEPRFIVLSRDITERKAAEQQLHDLAANILNVREDEKIRIAREIHDELGGTLNVLKLDAYWLSRKLSADDEALALAGRIQLMSQRIDDAISFTRHIIDDMRPAVLDDLGLLAAIEWQAEEFSKHTGIECQVSCIEDEANLDKQRSIALFRILQEALTNVSRHSRASRVNIEFLHNEHEVLLTVSDNGCGMSKSLTSTKKLYKSKSYGMLGMKERIEQLGGKIMFSSPQEGGFSIEAILPLPADEEGA